MLRSAAAPTLSLLALASLTTWADGQPAQQLRGPAAARALQSLSLPPRPADVGCLNYLPYGCNTAWDKLTCLRSKDGRQANTWKGLRIYAEPCVWCGGGHCTTNNSNLCEPYDFMAHGQYIGFQQYVSKTGHEVADCTTLFGVQLKAMSQVRSRLCAAHPRCAGKGLLGSCCPNPYNLTLACCEPESPAAGAAAEGGAQQDLQAIGRPVGEGKYDKDAWWRSPQPASAEETSCLMEHRYGCYVVKDRGTCLGSKDGRKTAGWYSLKIKDQPCVWCGGAPCRDGADNWCEPLDFLMHGEGTAFHQFLAKHTYQVAKCKDGQPRPYEYIYRRRPLPTLMPTLAPLTWTGQPLDPDADLSCLKDYALGCPHIQDMGLCLTSRDGRDVKTDPNGLRIEGEPCVWCGGTKCHNNASSLCEPYDYVMRGEGSAFGLFYAKTTFTAASCKKRKKIPPPQHDQRCLKDASAGCYKLTDASSCLSHRDGRQHLHIDGLLVKGQPCVWCGGSSCSSKNGNLCEPFDFAVNGQGQAFDLFHAEATYRIAGCKNRRPSAVTLSAFPDDVAGYFPVPLGRGPEKLVPFWVANKPSEEEMSCLKPYASGCSSIKAREICMTSRDGSGIEEIHGLKVHGEPCVWCGGATCTTNNNSLCEPFNYAMYGAGKAFTSFNAKGIYRVASCSKGNISLPKSDYTCLDFAASSQTGCPGITNAETCLASKDSRAAGSIGALKLHGQPCVWCGGGPCHSGGGALCEAFDYAVNGEGWTFEVFNAWDTFRLASCYAGHPAAATLKGFTNFVPGYTFKPPAPPLVPVYNTSWWKSHEPAPYELSCLMDHRFGCDVIVHQATCLGSKDGRNQALFGDRIKIHGQACVWCGGNPCRSGSVAKCEPFDFLMNGEGSNFTTFFAKDDYQVARCRNGKPQPPMARKSVSPFYYRPANELSAYNASWWKSPEPAPHELSCLMDHRFGCEVIDNHATCLGSKDGRNQALFGDGIKIHGQACVWCGGNPCRSGSVAKCEPFDFLMNGEGSNFTTFFAKHDYQIARCRKGKPQPPIARKSVSPWAVATGASAATESVVTEAGQAASALASGTSGSASGTSGSLDLGSSLITPQSPTAGTGVGGVGLPAAAEPSGELSGSEKTTGDAAARPTNIPENPLAGLNWLGQHPSANSSGKQNQPSWFNHESNETGKPPEAGQNPWGGLNWFAHNETKTYGNVPPQKGEGSPAPGAEVLPGTEPTAGTSAEPSREANSTEVPTKPAEQNATTAQETVEPDTSGVASAEGVKTEGMEQGHQFPMKLAVLGAVICCIPGLIYLGGFLRKDKAPKKKKKTKTRSVSLEESSADVRLGSAGPAAMIAEREPLVKPQENSAPGAFAPAGATARTQGLTQAAAWPMPVRGSVAYAPMAAPANAMSYQQYPGAMAPAPGFAYQPIA